jgi:hypothetical protein
MDQTANRQAEKSNERPRYESPRIQEMTEREILNTFQVTQAMQTWWVAAC